jgi:hypothetical protein
MIQENQPSRLLYAVSVRRGRYLRRSIFALIGGVASFGAAVALVESANRGVADSLLLNTGALLAIVLAGWFAVRCVFNLARWLGRRSADIRIYNQGVLWNVGGRERKYRWKQTLRYRQAARGLYIFSRPLIIWGANTLEMLEENNRTRTRLRFTAAFGDPRDFDEAVNPFASHITGMRIGAALRRDEPVTLHRALRIFPGGVEVSGRLIHWADLEAELGGNRLVIRMRRPDGKMKTVRRFAIRHVDNVGGFLDVAASMAAQYRASDAFRRQTSGPPVTYTPAGR